MPGGLRDPRRYCRETSSSTSPASGKTVCRLCRGNLNSRGGPLSSAPAVSVPSASESAELSPDLARLRLRAANPPLRLPRPFPALGLLPPVEQLSSALLASRFESTLLRSLFVLIELLRRRFFSGFSLLESQFSFRFLASVRSTVSTRPISCRWKKKHMDELLERSQSFMERANYSFFFYAHWYIGGLQISAKNGKSIW